MRWKWFQEKLSNYLTDRREFNSGDAFVRDNCRGRWHCNLVTCLQIFIECLFDRTEKKGKMKMSRCSFGHSTGFSVLISF